MDAQFFIIAVLFKVNLHHLELGKHFFYKKKIQKKIIFFVCYLFKYILIYIFLNLKLKF